MPETLPPTFQRARTIVITPARTGSLNAECDQKLGVKGCTRTRRSLTTASGRTRR